MKVGVVSGTVTSTINHPFFDGERLLLCEVVDRSDPTGDYLICTDRVDAGFGDTVLILDEGTSARQVHGVATGPIRSVVVGIVDDIHEEESSS
ncbi:MAG: EutN/CcmL family microcompartment protein [Acidimicrobiia bacterium]